MKAIIVAAGRGRRLGPETADIPKCMVAVGGRPILHRQLDALALAGVDEVVIVRGYLGTRIALPHADRPGGRLRVTFVENPAWADNNILASLFYAEPFMDDGFVFSYSDIVFARAHASLAVASTADVGLVIDRRWDETYVGRLNHPLPEAELAAVTGTPPAAKVTQVGKGAVPAAEAAGEFIGLARFSSRGARALRDAWREASEKGLEQPYGRALALRIAYLTDALNAMITGSLARPPVTVEPLFIDGRWREIDTEEDLGRAHALVDGWDL